MFSRVIPIIASVILIAVYALLFNFSLPKLEKRLQIKEATDASVSKTKDFFSNLSEKEKQVLLSLPCAPDAMCEGRDEFKSKFEASFAGGIIKKGLILNQNSIEIFSNRAIEPKYIKLVNEAKTQGKSFLKENTTTLSETINRTINVIKISEPTGQQIFENRFVLVLTDDNGINLSTPKMIFGAATLVPIIIILAYLLIRSSGKSGGETAPSKKSGDVNQKYINEIEDLKKVNIQQSQFLANFTHELRTPLNSIIGFSGLLKDQTLGTLGNQEYLKYANDINTSGVHLLSLINDILDYSKSESGKLKVNITEVDVVKVLKQALSIIGPRASESRVELMQSFSSDYFIVRLDPKRFKQIMLNLLSNSVKFTPEGGSVTVSVFPDLKGDKVSIEVKDTGVGIAEKDIPTVMSLFGQVETDLNRKYEGTGIGLPFAKKLTTIMGGTFDLQSQVGVGTSITLSFPYDKKLNAEYQELYKKQ